MMMIDDEGGVVSKIMFFYQLIFAIFGGKNHHHSSSFRVILHIWITFYRSDENKNPTAPKKPVREYIDI